MADREVDRGVQERSLSGIATESALEALQDPDCRAILTATSGEALSASEIGERCDLPLSTTYRKLECLTDAHLLAEHTRISRTGKHASEYTRRVEAVTVDVAEDGSLTVSVTVQPSGGFVPPRP